MNRSKKKLLVLFFMILFVVIGIAAIKAPQPQHKNLKVLPQDISDQKLDSIMQSYNVALGVNCKFCHVPAKGFKDSLDYAADGEPMKEEARKMITMNIYINKTWFNYKNDPRPEYLTNVTCNTCHKGEAFPEH